MGTCGVRLSGWTREGEKTLVSRTDRTLAQFMLKAFCAGSRVYCMACFSL